MYGFRGLGDEACHNCETHRRSRGHLVNRVGCEELNQRLNVIDIITLADIMIYVG